MNKNKKRQSKKRLFVATYKTADNKLVKITMRARREEIVSIIDAPVNALPPRKLFEDVEIKRLKTKDPILSIRLISVKVKENENLSQDNSGSDSNIPTINL